MKSGLSTNAVKRISAVLNQIITDFPEQEFERDAFNGLEKLELKQRVDHLIAVLADYLPADFSQAAEVLLQLKTNWDWGDENDALSSFAAWPLVDYVAVYGLEHPELALKILKHLTALFSAEFAVRPFIELNFELTQQTLLTWCTDDDEQVRRLASEGSRPRLPWGKRLAKFCNDPSAILPILVLLKDDTSLYVRRSVANNLNDISKDNPDCVIQLCRQWAYQAPAQRQWLIRHALRSLVKQGRIEVFPLLGYTEQPDLKLMNFCLDKSVIKLGEKLALSIELRSLSKHSQKFVLDYKVHHRKANGSTTAKVFKWKNISLAAYGTIELTKLHSFKQITTRTYYAGQHAIEILVNGQSRVKKPFQLMLE